MRYERRSYNKILILVVLSILSFSFNNLFIQGKNNDQSVVVIPIDGEINIATKNFVADSMDKVNKRSDVSMVIFDINTYGGLIDEAIEIKDIIMDTRIPTVSFVNNNAQSAGVLITIASENVAMSKNATIGSAETIPNTEKIMSMWRAVLRETAQNRNRDPLVIEAMADKDIVIDDVVVEGKLLNLTSSEALDLGISDMTANSYEEILNELDVEYTQIEIQEEDYQVKLAKYISNPYINSLFLTIAFVGLVIEIFSPGFGLGGTVSIIGFGLYFGGNILAGHSNWTSLILFITGFILLIIEAMVPGFGLPGISGIVLVFTGLIMAVNSLGLALVSISFAIIVTAVITFILVKLGYRNKIFDKFVLTTDNIDDTKPELLKKEELVGKIGKSVSILRPSGFIEIDGRRYDALSDGDFIKNDTEIIVTRIENNQILVRRR